MSDYTGKFIVFEGIDGCGKGTQLKKVHSYLWSLDKNIDIYSTREPTRDYQEIRKRMAKGTNVKKDAQWYASKFVEDRYNHARTIRQAISKGVMVLCDRYMLSTLAYQHTQGLKLNELIKMHQGILVPDLTLIVDCPAKIAFERRREEGAPDVFDRDLEFQEKLRKNYIKIKGILEQKKIGGDIEIIDGSKSVGEVFEQVKNTLESFFN